MDDIIIKLNYLIPVLLLLTNLITANNIHIDEDIIERDVIYSNIIEKSGLCSVGDILLLANKIRVNTLDGFTWSANINGLSSFQKQNWVILLNGQRLGLNTFNKVNINMLPINIAQIDSVEIISVPQIYNGIFTNYGLIHIHTKSISNGKTITFFQSAGNETGDPGPYIHTKYKSPNVDKVGTETAATLEINNKDVNLNAGINFRQSSVTDWAVVQRNTAIFHDKAVDTWPSIEMFSSYFELDRKRTKSNNHFFINYSRAYKYFLFFSPLSREIPIDYIIKHVGMNNNFTISDNMSIAYRLDYSTNQFNKFPNSLDIDFDWESNNLHANLENQFIFSSYNGKLGIGFDRYSLNTNYELSKSFYDIYSYYGAFNYSLTENIIQDIDLMVALSNGQHAFKGAFITKWYINPKHTLSLIISNTQRLEEEDNSLWYWSKLGYGLINTDFTINGSLDKSRRFTTDLIWGNKINDKLTIEISNYYRSFDDIYLEQQYFSFNPEDGSFTSSPLTIHANQEGIVIGVNCTIKNNINSTIYQYLHYDYQSELSSNDIFKNVMKTIPKHSLDYQLIFSPIQNFSIWTKFSYNSSSQWENYKNINGESYLTVHQDTLKYSNIVGSSNVIDLGIQKWLFKRKINTKLFFRNVFNKQKRYHPIGASFDLTLYFHITYYPFKNY